MVKGERKGQLTARGDRGATPILDRSQSRGLKTRRRRGQTLLDVAKKKTISVPGEE